MKSPLFEYDKAVYDLIHALYDKVYYGSPDEIFSINAKRNGGKVVLPFISVYRLPDFSINLEMANDSFLRTGYVVRSSNTKGIEFPNQKVAMHGLPVTLEYQIEVFATKRDVCDGLIAELMLYLRAHPYVNVPITEAGDRVQEFSFDLQESAVDNTDIMGFDEGGRLYRMSITADITEAVIYLITDIGQKIDTVEIELTALGHNVSMKDVDDYLAGDDGYIEVDVSEPIVVNKG